MDDIVRAALAKWPNVPACRGWLALDARGDWYMRDEACQRAGPFAQARGSRIQHDKLLAFIHRNYEADAQGAWFFQNGPQRVYVELEATPLVLRLHPDGRAHDHTGSTQTVQGLLLDEHGWLYARTPRALALVHSLDMHAAAQRIESGAWPEPEPVSRAELPVRYGFVKQP